MAVRKTPVGRYQIDYRDHHGNRFRKTYDTRREAEAALAKVRLDLNAGKYIAPRKSPTFEEVAAQWLRSKQAGCRPVSVAGWRTHLDRHLLPRLGVRRMNEIDVRMLERMRDELRDDDGLSAHTINKLLMTTSAIFKLALRHNYCAGNPAAIAERARRAPVELGGESEGQIGDGSGQVREDEVLSPDEVRRLIAAAEPGLYRALFFTIACSGLRSSEGFGLHWDDIDFDGGLIHVRCAVSRSAGADGKWEAKFFEPKSKAGLRSIPLAPELAHELKVWKVQCPPNPHDLVFPSATGAPLHRSVVRLCGLKPAWKQAKLRHIGLHSLRHSFASALIAQGAAITEVQHLLGHSNPQVTCASTPTGSAA